MSLPRWTHAWAPACALRVGGSTPPGETQESPFLTWRPGSRAGRGGGPARRVRFGALVAKAINLLGQSMNNVNRASKWPETSQISLKMDVFATTSL